MSGATLLRTIMGAQNGLRQGARPKTASKRAISSPFLGPESRVSAAFPDLPPHLEFRGPENVAPGRFLSWLSTIEKPPTGVRCRHGVSRIGTPRLRDASGR